MILIPLNISGFLMIPSTFVLVILRMNEWMIFRNCTHDPQTTYSEIMILFQNPAEQNKNNKSEINHIIQWKCDSR